MLTKTSHSVAYVDVEVTSLFTDHEHEHEHGLPQKTRKSFPKTSHSVAFVDVEVDSLSTDYEDEHEQEPPQDTWHSARFTHVTGTSINSLIRKYAIC